MFLLYTTERPITIKEREEISLSDQARLALRSGQVEARRRVLTSGRYDLTPKRRKFWPKFWNAIEKWEAVITNNHGQLYTIYRSTSLGIPQGGRLSEPTLVDIPVGQFIPIGDMWRRKITTDTIIAHVPDNSKDDMLSPTPSEAIGSTRR